MASDEIQKLIDLTEFLGIDQSTDELLMKKGFALQAVNCNTSIIKGALLPERGRTELFDASAFHFGSDTMTSINILYPVVGPDNAPGVLFQGPGVAHALLTGYYDYTSATFTNITNANPFTQAVQFMNVVYTNGGQRFFVGQANGGGPGIATQMFSWQYPAPVVTYRETNPATPNGIGVNWTYAIATLGFGTASKIQENDILTTTINTTSGPQSIPYTVGSTVGVPDSTYAILVGHIADAINAFYTTGGGSGDPNKVTATSLVDFDVANNPGTAKAQNPVGILLSSNASGAIGNTYTVVTSMSAGSTENYLTTGRTSNTYPVDSVNGTFFGGNPAAIGDMLGGYYFYLFTRVTTMPDGTVSETSVVLDAQATSFQSYPPVFNPSFFPAAYDAPLQVNVGEATYGSNSAVLFLNGLTNPFIYQWTGTNADGSTFTTNIYRASSLTDVFQYQFVGNVSIPDTTPGAIRFIDTFSNLEISGNAVLVVHRDPPPFVAPVHTIDHTQTYNFGFMSIHQNRIFALTAINVPITASQGGTQYIYQQPQIQVWYSNLARGWEFDLVNQVLLVNADVVTDILTQHGNGFLGPDYDAFYGNMPKALTEVGTELMASMKREQWVIWGDGTTNNPYVAKKAFNYGTLASSTGVLGVRGGMFFVTESGDIYWYDGNAPQNKSEDVRAAIKLNSINTGFDYATIAQSCLAFSNDALYWCFPSQGISFSYSMTSNTWMSQLPYAPSSRYAVASSPWNPATFAALEPNEVLAARFHAPTVVDQWFSDPSGDVGIDYQIFTWLTPRMDAGKPEWRKWFKLLRAMSPKEPGVLTVDLMIDDDEDVTHTFSKTIDLDGTQKSKTKKFQGDTGKIIGIYAQVKLTVQGVPGKPAPILWGVGIYGSLSDNLLVNPGE
jgi:hypothetical protein